MASMKENTILFATVLHQQNGDAPVHKAALLGHAEVTAALLSGGASPDVTNQVCVRRFVCHLVSSTLQLPFK